MPQCAPPADAVFKALADPTRREVIERMASGPSSTTHLAEAFSMAMRSFVQHLAVLDGAGQLSSSKDGRMRTYWLTPDGPQCAGLASRPAQPVELRLDQSDQLLIDHKGQR
jgi:DNA-binding transcriptional ArsR family regulator